MHGIFLKRYCYFQCFFFVVVYFMGKSNATFVRIGCIDRVLKKTFGLEFLDRRTT